MSRCVAANPSSWPRLIASLALLTALAACGSQPARHGAHSYKPARYYPPPGPPSDPWGPYIQEAAGRFGVPDRWIRRVMRQESGGRETVVSRAGAMGLMQVMPNTYDELKYRHSLGDDPFDPHNNILAGTAYLREMYDRFGAPAFLAAYNAGPNRLDRYLNGGTPLPRETVNYVAALAPQLGPGTPMSGPLAVYGDRATRFAAARPTPGGCDPDAAYNPDRPCAPFHRATVQQLAVASAAPSYGSADCDPDAAYDPGRPCAPLRAEMVQPIPAASMAPSFSAAGCDPDAAYDPTRPCQPLPPTRAPVIAQPLPPPSGGYASSERPIQERSTQRVSYDPAPPTGRWAIQVGAYANRATAQNAAETARTAAADLLRTATIDLPPTAPFGSQVAFRARLRGLSQSTAADACGRLSGRGIPCITVPPDRGSF
jgi:D-alanyl-D-alanine carboxypeptidase